MAGIIGAINAWASQAAGSVASPQLNLLMPIVSASVYVVMPLVMVWLYLRKDKNVFYFALTFVCGYALGVVLKLIVAEPRPCVGKLGCETDYSFPSNHATSLTGPALFLAGRKYLRVAYALWLVLVLFSRVYLGQHYLTDVIAGVVLSLILAYVIRKNEDWINNVFISKLPIRIRWA